MTNLENFPAQLRENALFCCWRYEERNGKKTKVPYNPATGQRAKSSDPATFAALSVAVAASKRYDGLGVGIFGTLGAIDIDHCLTNGVPSELAKDIMTTMDTYTEISPSGEGLRLLFWAPGFRYDTVRYYINNRKLGLEVYIAGATKKYVTVTGNVYGFDRMEERSEQLKTVLEKHMVRRVRPVRPQTRQNPPAPPPNVPATPSDLDDLTLIQRAQNARNGDRFNRLWSGDTTDYQSQSEADMALCNALAFWTGRDVARMDRLFRQSGLMREKWDRKQSGSTYGAITIQNAVRSCREVYEPGRGRERPEGREGSLRPRDFSDAGNAAVFSRRHKDDLIFTDALGWLWWTGQKWERDDHKALSRALELSGEMLREALGAYTDALHQQAEAKARYAESGEDADKNALEEANAAARKAKAYLTHAQQTRNATRLRHMLELSKPALVKPTAELDANPFDLNTPGGIVDLNTGQLRPHDRTAYCTRITGTAPGTQGAELWDAFLDTITEGDPSVAGFLQVVAGMALFGRVFHEGIILAYGGGRNGKSTFFNALGAAAGDYTGSIDTDTLVVTRGGNKGASLATLRGKRLVITGELEEHQRLSASMLKRLASTDLLRIEEKYRAPEDIIPSHSIVLFTNHLPRVGSTDGGTWRRLIVVPFNAVIPVQNGVANYGDVLVRETGPAILSWAIEGAVTFARNRYKLDLPEAVAEATEEYRAREDWLSNFIAERCQTGPNLRTGSAELYRAYKDWAEQSGEYVRRLNDFNAAMEAAGFHQIRPGNRKTWEGLRLDIKSIYPGFSTA